MRNDIPVTVSLFSGSQIFKTYNEDELRTLLGKMDSSVLEHDGKPFLPSLALEAMLEGKDPSEISKIELG